MFDFQRVLNGATSKHFIDILRDFVNAFISLLKHVFKQLLKQRFNSFLRLVLQLVQRLAFFVRFLFCQDFVILKQYSIFGKQPF